MEKLNGKSINLGLKRKDEQSKSDELPPTQNNTSLDETVKKEKVNVNSKDAKAAAPEDKSANTNSKAHDAAKPLDNLKSDEDDNNLLPKNKNVDNEEEVDGGETNLNKDILLEKLVDPGPDDVNNAHVLKASPLDFSWF